MADPAAARSPLAHLAESLAAVAPSTSGALRIEEVPFLAQVDIRLDPSGAAAEAVGLAVGAALPLEPGTRARTAGVAVLWLGPDEWLVVGDPGSAADLESRVRAAATGNPVSVVDVSAQRTTLVVAGPAARDVLATGCAIDLHERAFPEGACVQTMLARTGVILVADDVREPAFRLVIRASFADYAASWLLDAVSEHIAAPVAADR